MWLWPTLKEMKTPAASRKGQCLKFGRRAAAAGGSARSSVGLLPGKAGFLPTTSGRNLSFPHPAQRDPAVPAGLSHVFNTHLNLSVSTQFQGRRPLGCCGECLVQQCPVTWGLGLLLWCPQKARKPGRNHISIFLYSGTHPPSQWYCHPRAGQGHSQTSKAETCHLESFQTAPRCSDVAQRDSPHSL